MPDHHSKAGISIVRNGVEISAQSINSIRIEFGFSKIPKATILINDSNLSQQNFAESERLDGKLVKCLI